MIPDSFLLLLLVVQGTMEAPVLASAGGFDVRANYPNP